MHYESLLRTRLLGAGTEWLWVTPWVLSAKSMKPETVRQLFGSMDGFKDVRPFIGKGIKRFKMQGLYGGQTQSALVIADSLLKNKKGETSENFTASY